MQWLEKVWILKLFDYVEGKAPDFHHAMDASGAKALYEYFVLSIGKQYAQEKIKSMFPIVFMFVAGCFQTYMTVGIVNDGPTTVEIESPLRTEVFQEHFQE